MTASASAGRITSRFLPRTVVVDPLQRGVEHVEVADHAPVVELLALDDHLEAVVVLVELAFGPFDAGHDVLRGELDRGADLEHGLPVPQRGVDQSFGCPASIAA